MVWCNGENWLWGEVVVVISFCSCCIGLLRLRLCFDVESMIMMGVKEGVKKRMSCWYGFICCGIVYWVWGLVEFGGDIIVMSGLLL